MRRAAAPRPTVVFSPWTSFALLVLYAVVPLAIGCWVLVRRDA